MKPILAGRTTVSEISRDEAALASGGSYAAINSWAIGTSAAVQALIVARLELLGNPFAGGGAH
jgi:hypothetical protein